MQTADDFYAGAGGWDCLAPSLGIHARGIENMAAARRTRDAAALTTVHDDVWTYRPDGTATGGIASPPCTPFSRAGKGKGRDNLDLILRAITTGAYRDLARLQALGTFVDDDRLGHVLVPLHFALGGHGYRWLAWEQVPDVLPVWEACADELRMYGWHVWTGVLNAEQYGVPQTRRRAVLIASLDGEVYQPTPTHSAFHRQDPRRLDPGVLPWVSAADALHAAGRDRTDLPAWCHVRPSTTVVGSFRPEVVAAPGYRTDVSRQNAPDSLTVSVAEAGVLQSFPADYPWQGGTKGGDGPAYLQVGNAIPPRLAYAVLSVAAGVPNRHTMRTACAVSA